MAVHFDLTQIKCYRDWEVDEASADTLARITNHHPIYGYFF